MSDQPWLAALRARAAERFAADGWPDRRTEHWKYTPVAPIERARLAPVDAAAQRAEVQAVRAAVAPEAADFVRDFSDLPPAVQAGIGRVAALEGHAFAARNLLDLHDGLVIHVPRGVRVAAPIVLAWGTPAVGAARPVRVLVLAEAQAEVTVIERFDGDGEGAALTNAVTEIIARDGAQVRYAKAQLERDGAFHVGRVAIEAGRDARVEAHLLNLGGALARTELDVALVAPGADVALKGLFGGRGARHQDQHVTVRHQSPRATSDQDFRGVLAAGAQGVFTGLVHVAAGAHHTRATQQNRNLLLDAGAHVDTRPQLEIHNDDVQCSHGATTGRLDATALFYLRSRGLDATTARQLLTLAFAAELTEALPDEALRALALDRLRDAITGG